ncbi:D-isomer specific 2-hydroxyacid dehydrogenase [Fusarium flagelliforme]|uniref:D-3-phosphoglycerate dehydrogenase n=1 Tax=Fusarium flagelliforme TaxID=2675880 RepID=A0A395MUT1_9HYPO|nr:D-isomer specific 2-hydroxyacid dehydrogenase [Fusarium flagelliforme]KAH7182656.1 D-isomer specific 2-hydroxyacid dehydrogenase [Fusarium flagelliforme]RFN50959.1 d-3-phosphoglycerate dehydrogenase [Fusarium flagelliforme]
MADKPKVLFLGSTKQAQEDFASLSEVVKVVYPKSTDRATFIEESKSGAFDGIQAIYRSNKTYSLAGNFDAELLDSLPKTLKFICHNGAGYDQIHIQECTSRGIRVSNTPTAVDDATADITIFLLIGALRNLSSSIFALREGTWRGNPAPSLGHDPQGKVLGILGMGGIGRNVARKARAFGMIVKYYNRSRLSPELEGDAEYVDFETLLKESDVLSLNLPLNPKTRHTIAKPQFDIMKRGVVIINTARGAVMDEAALVDALESGQVASAGLDVFENEPEVHPGLVNNRNVLLVPHMGTWTVETERAMAAWAFDNIRLAVTEGKLKSIVPEQSHLQ